jgi:cell wall-associated NlpC family hydrolase
VPNLSTGVLDAAINQQQRQDDEALSRSVAEQAAPIRNALFGTLPDLGSLLGGLNPTPQPSGQQPTVSSGDVGQEVPGGPPDLRAPAGGTPRDPAGAQTSGFQLPGLDSLLSGLNPAPPKTAQPNRAVTTPSAPGIADARPAALSGTPQAMPTGQPSSEPRQSSAQPEAAGAIDNSTRETFVRTAYPYALRAADGDPALANQLLATAISENGAVGTGRSLGEMGFNVGGIQGVEGPAGSFTALDAGRPRQFAAYNDLSEGFRAVKDLVSGGRYASAAANYRQTGDIDRYWREINQAGYSETPDWQDKVADIRRNQVEPLTRDGSAARPSPTTPPPAEQTPAAQQQASGTFDVQDVAGRYGGGSYVFGGGRDAEGGLPGVKDSDCSSFVSGVWRERGVPLVAHTDGAYTQLRNLGAPEVKRQDAQPGDVVFYMGEGYGGNITYHMGIYAGGGQVLDQSRTGGRGPDGVRLRSLTHAGSDIVILRDPRVNQQQPRHTEEPPPIVPTGIAEQTGGRKPTEEQIQSSVPTAGGPTPVGPQSPAGVPLPPAGDAGQGDMMRRSLGEPQPMPEDASQSERYVQDLSRPNEPAPSPYRNVVPFDPETNQTGIPPNTPAELLMQRAPLMPTDPEASTGAEYDPRDADQGAHEWMDPGVLTTSESTAPIPPSPSSPSSPYDDPDSGPREAIPGSVGAGPVGPLYEPEPAPEPESPLKPLYDLGGQIVGYVQDRVGQTLGAAPSVASRALERAAGPLSAAGTAVQESYNDPLWATAPAPARAIKIVSDTFQAYGDAAARRVAAELGVSDEELFSILGHPVSGQDIAGLAGGALLDPTTYSPAPAAGAIRRAAGPVAAAVLDPAGAALGAAGRGIRRAGTRVAGALEANAENVARADARMAAEGSTAAPGTLGVVPPDEPVRIPRAGYATDITPGAEDLVRQASERNAPAETVSRAEVARRAEEVLGVKPDAAQRWQAEALAEAPDTRAVRGEALRQAEYVDAENANRAIERLREAQRRASEAGGVENMAPDDRFDVADALLEAAETARAFERSAAASTAEGRATARALNQRRNAITARQAFVSAERARQAGQDAAFAAREVQRAADAGQVTEEGVRRLRIVRDKLLDAERHGLVGDGAGGRLDAREQRSAVAMATLGVNPRPGVGLGTRVAGEIGSSLAGGVMGASAGAARPADTTEERRRNALIGAGAGMIGGPVVRRFMGRGRGALATFGAAPTPENPTRAIAIGANPARRYEFRYRVANLDDLVPSNLPSGAPNPAFPRELQPRSRERVASQLQIDQIARGLEPDALLTDVGRLDSGPMIVGPDRIVESGNGRTLALQRAVQEYPERYQAYVDTLRRDLSQYGLSEADLAGVQRPVLVRERVSDVNRVAFAQDANNAGLLRMSSVEQAAQDAGNLSDDVVTALQVGENDTIASALRKTENRDLVRRWVGILPENERAGVLDASGQLSAQGYDRLTNALLMRTYGQGAGERLARAFIESADPTVRNVQTALMASLPDVARAEALIRSGAREASLSIADDVAAATEMLARLRRDGIPVNEYLSQSAMFERELTPFQEDILGFLADNQRRPSAIREALREYARRVENAADPNQGAMFGNEIAGPTREDLWRGSTAGSEREAVLTPLEARAEAGRAPADGAGLARAASEPVAPVIDIPPSPERPAARSAQPVAPQRPGTVADDFAPSGGPEGTLARRYAADRSVPAGPIPENMAATGGPEGTLTLASGRSIKDVAARIDEVLANPNAPGAADRLRDLHADLQEISTQGFKRSSEIRARLQRNGLLRAGLASKDQNVDALVTALARVDPEKPEEMRAVLAIISKPRLIDKLLEYQYVNMLSSPITQAVNISSNVMQIAGRLLLQNPLEAVYSGGRSTGAGAAFQGAWRGVREGIGEAGQIMRTGTSSEQINRAIEVGDYSHVNREALTEQFGAAGAFLHTLSTRPLAAMDALLGHVAYASAAEQYAQRKADRLLAAGAESVRGMSRQDARQQILANIWDHPEIIERAGKIEDYTLLRSKDTQGKAWGRVESALRQLASVRNPAEDAGFAGQAAAFMINQVMPFFNVPLNFAKQGVERTAGVPVNAVRSARAFARGETERAAELAAKATIGAAAITTAGVLAAGDNLTGDGPSDDEQRRVWEQTHRRNSFRVPGTSAWISWEGTPFAIPFGMVAGMKEGAGEALERSAKKGQTDPVDVVGSAALKAGQGASSAFLSQSFVRGLADQYKLLTGQDVSLASQAAAAAGTASRFVPASGMLNLLARVTDSMERDPGRPQAVSDLPKNVGARIATRLPGLRQQVDPKLDIYGQSTPNEQFGAAGLLPYYRGAGTRADDPVTQRLEVAGRGISGPPAEVSVPGVTGSKIVLTMSEQRAYQEYVGQARRKRLDSVMGNGRYDGLPEAARQKMLDDIERDARSEAAALVRKDIGPAELRRRDVAAQKRAG